MPKASKMTYYAVKKGRTPGIYRDWPTAEAMVKGFHGAEHHKFATEAEALEYLGRTRTTTSATPTAHSNTSPKGRKPYQPPVKQAEKVDESKWLVIYTDGSCTNNGAKGAKAGIGVWYGHDDPRNLAERCPGEQTNNRAELIALIRALETALPSDKPILLKTDSSYSIGCVRDWLPKWRTTNYRTANGQPVKNIQLILYLAHLLQQRPGVRLEHIKGHAGHEGNEGADRLANRGGWQADLADRDWSIPKEDNNLLTKPAETKITSSAMTAEELAQYADCLLDDDEMERIGNEQDF